MDAPQKCGGQKAWEVVPRRFRCRLDKPGVAAVVASVCDDANTFCKQARFDVTVTGVAKIGKAAPNLAAPKGGHTGPAGFSNDPVASAARAKKEGKPLFVHFFGIWCPPCNELEEHAYPTPEFKAAAADYVLIALDADAPVSFDWKARFKVGGYPTLVVADGDLREIGRVVGSRSGAGLAKFLGEMALLKGRPVEDAARAVAKDPAAPAAERLRVARWRAERAEFDEVERLLAGRTDPASRRVLLEARDERRPPRRRRPGPRRQRAPAAARVPRRRRRRKPGLLVAAVDALQALGLRQAVRSSVEVWTASPSLGETWFSAADLLTLEADYIETVVSTQAARPLWLKAAAAHEAKAASSPLGAAARAANFSRADALRRAGENEAAAGLLASLVKAYPDEFTFHNEYAYTLKEMGRYADAYPAAVRAVETGYGDNWLRAVKIKAELELKLGRAKDAARTVDEALAETVLPATTDVRSFRYVASLRALRAEIAKKL